MPALARLSESLGIPTFCAIWSAVAKPNFDSGRNPTRL